MNSSKLFVVLQAATRWIAFAVCFFILYIILTGFPVHFLETPLPLKMKNLKTLFMVGFGALLIHACLDLQGPRAGLTKFKNSFFDLLGKPRALSFLIALYAALFFWQQLSEYLALMINFLPFSFFDYILYYFFHGKVNYTGLLHTYYHFNNILLFLAPLWAIFKTPLLLVSLYGPLAALAAIPLYKIAYRQLGNSAYALVIAFIYLNYRYLQSLLQMNFCVEVFYPLFIFWAVYAALTSRWTLYYVFVLLGLLVKEDSFIYYTAVGGLVFFLPQSDSSKRIHGVITVLLSFGYLFFILKIFGPMTGNTVIERDLMNFHSHEPAVRQSSQLHETLHPFRILKSLFDSSDKMKTYSKLFSSLLFLPFLSPSILFVAAPLLPLFLHNTGRDIDFIDLRYHYSAAVIPFVFIAFSLGLANLYRWLKAHHKENYFAWLLILLVFMNGGRYRSEHFTQEDLTTLRWAQRIPKDATVVTHGHLLPYIGYKEYNFYLAAPFEIPEHKVHSVYRDADYYYLDKNVNPYPMDEAFVAQKIQDLTVNPSYELVDSDSTRFLFKRK